jgi:hypothetical protein
MKNLVISYRNSLSYKFFLVIKFEWPDYSLVKSTENMGAFWTKKHNFNILQVALCFGNEQYCDQQKSQ